MQGSIDIPIANGWHVTIFRPPMWLLVVVVAGVAPVTVKALPESLERAIQWE